MKAISFDVETCLIRPGLQAPPLVCLTYQIEGQKPQIVDRHASPNLVRSWLYDSNCVLVGHNVAYDAAVLCSADPSLIPLFFLAYKESRITDTMLRQKLLDIAAGKYRGFLGKDKVFVKRNYGLADLAHRFLGKVLFKKKVADTDPDPWRLRYAELLDVPLKDWPKEAVDYPIEDAVSTLQIYICQREHEDFLNDQFRQSRAAFALHLASAWGMKTHGPAVAALRAETEKYLVEVQERLVAAGLVRENGKRDTKAAMRRMIQVCQEESLPLRLTKTGELKKDEQDAASVLKGICLDADACEATADELLEDYAKFSTLKKVLSNDLEMLAKGATYPVHSRYDIVETGRTSSSKPNIQNIRRLPGIRECFIPRPDKVFIDSDYGQLELHTLAQVCLDLVGHSELAKVLNAGIDPHLDFAAHLLGITYNQAKERKKDKDVDAARQTAKVANFGFPGGLGAAKLVKFAWTTYGVEMTEGQAKALKSQWLSRWTEMKDYFNYANGLCNGGAEKLATFQHVRSLRWRGGCHYTATCNSFFQGLGSDVAKHALWKVQEKCYTRPDSSLYGGRVVNFVHDQIILEHDDKPEVYDRAARELASTMIHAANEWLPDVPAKTDPCVYRFWSKDAVAVFHEGKHRPWFANCTECRAPIVDVTNKCTNGHSYFTPAVSV